MEFKQVLDEKGGFSHLEICQGSNVIEITFSHPHSTANPNNWHHLKERIDQIAERVQNE